MASESQTPLVPIVDLRQQNDPLRAQILAEVNRIIDTSSFVHGPAVTAFEEAFAEYCGTAHCVGMNSGTSALHVAMLALDVGPGDEVVTVSMSFIATAWPILYLGATPVFVDIDPERFTLDPEALKAAITPRTKAIVPVHLYGQCADMDSILEIADQHGIPVIEDAAQAAGASYKGRAAGSMGSFGCFSFYPTKTLGAFGEGGAVTTNDPELAKRAAMLRDHGQESRYNHTMVGYNFRLDSIQAAVLHAKLPHLESYTEGRIEVARNYDRGIANPRVKRPNASQDGRHCYHQYVVRVDDRDAFRTHLERYGVGSGIHYPHPIHAASPFSGVSLPPSGLGETESLARTCVSLPMFAEMTDAQVDAVVAAVNSYAG